MRITFLGTGSIIPTARRFASSVLVTRGDLMLLLDCGPSTLEKMRVLGVNPNHVAMLLITHFHVDHVSDLLPLIKLRAFDEKGYAAELPSQLLIIGPTGLKRLLSHLIEDIGEFSYLSSTLHCFDYVTLVELSHGQGLEQLGCQVSAAAVSHFNGLAYRLTVDGKSVVYSGDTVPDERLVKLAAGCDLLIHECSFPEGMLLGKHTTDAQLAELLPRIRPKKTAVVHLYPVWEPREAELSEKFASLGYDVMVAKDLDSLEL